MTAHPALRLVSETKPGRKPKPAPTAASVARLLARAKADGRRLSLAFADDLDAMAEKAAELAKGGDAVGIGIRELASRIASDATAKAATVRSLAK